MKTLLTIIALTILAAVPATAQVWVEDGDAGDLPATAQVPECPSELIGINGQIASDADVDMYCITIVDPGAFSATTCGITTFDTQLWLFDVDGNGVTFDDDDPGGCGLQSTITGAYVPGPGQYFLAISPYNNDALNPVGDLIWANSPFSVERAPDGPGAPGPVASWTATGFSTGDYQIALTGAACCGPVAAEPSSWSGIKDLYR